MAQYKPFRKWRNLDSTAARLQGHNKFYSHLHSSSNSEENSSYVTQQIPSAISRAICSSRGSNERGSSCQGRRIANHDLDDDDVKCSTGLSKAIKAIPVNKAQWTDTKHSSYLNSIEAEFVRNLHGLEYSCNMVRRVEYLDEDCVESRPPKDGDIGIGSDEKAFGSRSCYSRHPICNAAESFSDKSNIFIMGICVKDSDSKLFTQKLKRCLVSFPSDYHQNTKRQAFGEPEFLDLELRVGDLQTRRFKEVMDQHFQRIHTRSRE